MHTDLPRQKTIQAKLKNEVIVLAQLEPLFTDELGWIESSSIIEDCKRQLIEKLKSELHEKIALLSLDDILFSISDSN